MVAIGHTSPEEAFVWRGGPCRGWQAGWRDPEIYVASARETLQSSQALRGLLGDCVAELRRSRRHGRGRIGLRPSQAGKCALRVLRLGHCGVDGCLVSKC